MHFTKYIKMYVPYIVHIEWVTHTDAFLYVYSATMYNSQHSKCTSLFFIPFVCNYKLCTAGTESRKES
jgi:hypothetical protein